MNRSFSAVARVAVAWLVSATSIGASAPSGGWVPVPSIGLRPEVMSEALSAMDCARRHGAGPRATRLGVIDYTRSSREARLWVMDLERGTLMFEEHVAHGRGSGSDIPTEFSDRRGSRQSSLGLFLTGSTYQGTNGYSLRLRGITKGFNESAARRLIVLHGAAYVNPVAARAVGRLGRSWGCPVVRPAVARAVIDALKDGQFVYVHGPGTARLAECRAEDLVITGVQAQMSSAPPAPPWNHR